MNENHLLSFVIAIIVSAIVLAVICSGCAPKPKPKTWIEIEMSKPGYDEKVSEGVRLMFENPWVFEQIELVIMEMQWRREDANGVVSNDARGESR